MTDNEKLIEAINRYLPKLNTRQLSTILRVLYEFVRTR